jgi:predicted transcriptional regulator
LEDIEQEIEDIIIQGLGHSARRTVLKIVGSTPNGASYTELLSELRLSTGKLNYHLAQLQGLIEKNKERRYVLTPLGEKAISLLNSITRDMGPEYESYIKTAQRARASALNPLVKSLIYIGMTVISVILIVWGYLAYVALTEGGPSFVLLLLPVLLTIGFVLLGWLIYALKTAPEFLRRLEKRLV